ncbi:MAG: DUF302 domain-containing protein [Nitrospirae bacterium]|nr:DUF302 domain-containing protein [Nitrospirota bacterium]
MATFGMRKELNSTYDAALSSVPDALKSEGFGILTEIDVKDTLKKKLNVDFRRYKILGACNPPFAHKALQAELEIGLLMPCNVIIYEGDSGKAVVAAVDPVLTMAAQGNARVKEIAGEVREKLTRVLERLC